MKKRIAALCVLAFFFLLPGAAIGFDCQHPPFGADLKELNQDGSFIKYMEKGGVSYYNYTGACRLPVHAYRNPSVSWAFVDNKLYAKILMVANGDFEGLKTRFPKINGCDPPHVSEEGDWLILTWKTGQGDIKVKHKYNKKTKQIKSVRYYEPLREKLAESEREPLDLSSE